MKKQLFSILSLLLAFTLTGCNDWLDVQSETEEKEEDLFTSYEGFRSALSGCYVSMAERDAYGERLSMSDIESMAHLWLVDENATYNPTNTYLAHHDYTNTNSETAIAAAYQALFKVVTQANVVRKHIQTDGSCIASERMRNIIEGEAYAIRAYCQMDLLRLFGQMPQGAKKQVMLPYSSTTELTEMPPYYSFADYVSLLEDDLAKAEALLRDNDPVCQYAFSEITTSTTNVPATVDDDFLTNRRFRLNYWAVKALQARLALYLGQTTKAYQLAKEVIAETKSDGTAKFELSGSSDLATSKNYFALPSEALFMLSKSTLSDYFNSSYVGGSSSAVNIGIDGSRYAVSRTAFDEMFQGVNTTSDNRYLNQWNKNLTNVFGQSRCCIKKYWHDDDAENLNTLHNVIPMLRMSEVYLIAIETAPTLSEANSLWTTYQRSHNVLLTADAFDTEATRTATLLSEYRREFFAEGQMFYTYKRTGAQTMLWSGTVGEDAYVVPLPSTEYNPN